MKKITSLFLATVLAFSALFSVSFNAFAAIDFSTAVAIENNTTVTDNVTQGSRNENDLYTVTAPSDGAYKIKVATPLQSDSKAYWKITFYNDQYEEIAETSIYGNKTSTEVVSMGVPAGKYYINVCSAELTKAKSTDNYVLKANFEASKYWEKELNESYTAATPAALNANYKGTTRDGSRNEKDYFSFELPSAEAVTIGFNVPLQADSGEYWKVVLYNGEYSEIFSAKIAGNKSSNTLPTIGLAKGKYYVCVTSSAMTSAKSTDVYTLKIGATASNVWEKELNENYTTATAMGINKYYYGTTNAGSISEKDYFKVNITSAQPYIIKFKTAKSSSTDNFWHVYVYDGSYKELDSIDVKGNAGLTKIYRTLSKGTYYIKITSSGYLTATSTAKYAIGVATKAKNPIKVKGKTVKLKYAKVKKANQTVARKKAIAVSKAKGTVTYAKASGNKKITVNKKTGKITVKKGLKKGTYKVKVKVKAAGNKDYKAATKTTTFKIQIK